MSGYCVDTAAHGDQRVSFHVRGRETRFVFLQLHLERRTRDIPTPMTTPFLHNTRTSANVGNERRQTTHFLHGCVLLTPRGPRMQRLLRANDQGALLHCDVRLGRSEGVTLTSKQAG